MSCIRRPHLVHGKFGRALAETSRRKEDFPSQLKEGRHAVTNIVMIQILGKRRVEYRFRISIHRQATTTRGNELCVESLR